MSKRSKLNRRRVLFVAARSRRIAPTFPLILTGLLGFSSLPAFSVSPTLPNLAGLSASSRLYAQTPLQFNATPSPRRSANFAQTPQVPQVPQVPRTVANAPQTPAQNQVVFFSIPVAADVAVVRSGPSEDAYPTGSVGKNRYVEAYFRSADGWCAIRPPQGSFSWVNAKFVRRETDSTGRIVATGGKAVPSRVGGATVEESALVQVGLKNGTAIKILDDARLADGSTWLKIAPPSGEFRWIRANDLIADPALAQLPTKLTFQREFLEQLAQTSNAERDAVARSPLGADALDSGSAPSSASVSPLGAPAKSTQTAQTPQSTQTEQTPQTAVEISPTSATPSVSEESAIQFKMELARLNADVFQTLRQNPPSDAELALLASRAETLFDAAPTDGERFVVQSIYDAIKIAERRNRAQSNAPNFRDVPNSPNQPGFPASSNSPNSPNFSVFSPNDGAPRLSGAEFEGDAPLLVLPDSSFEPSDDARSGAAWFDGSNDALFAQSPQSAHFNGRVDVSQFFPPSETTYSPNGFATNAPQPEKRPRLAFAFSNANSPFRSRSSKGKEAQVAPLAPQNGGRAAGISKLPPLLPTKKQLIVPPPNYRSNPFGQSARSNARLVAAKETSTAKNALRSTSEEAKKAEKTAKTNQNSEITQELTVDSVRWRAVDKGAVAAGSSLSSPSSSSTSAATADSSSKVASATATVPADGVNIAQASSIGATAPQKAPALTGATVAKSPNPPQTPKAPKTSKPSKTPKPSKTSKTSASPNSLKRPSASQPNKFRPVSSQTSAAFDAAGVLARLPKAPKGAPQYALTRPVGDNRFEIVSYLEPESGVSLEPYVGRNIGVKGTLGTIQIGENTQKITTVRTVFERD